MKALRRLAAAAAFLLPVAAHAESALELTQSGQPEIVQAWGPMCKYIGINGNYRWVCPNGAKVRDHRGCKYIAINGKQQRICKND